jgi:hypothetical protein
MIGSPTKKTICLVVFFIAIQLKLVHLLNSIIAAHLVSEN